VPVPARSWLRPGHRGDPDRQLPHNGRRFGCDEKQPDVASERHRGATTDCRGHGTRRIGRAPTPVNRQHGEFTVITDVRVNGQRCRKQLPARRGHYGERRVGQVEGPQCGTCQRAASIDTALVGAGDLEVLVDEDVVRPVDADGVDLVIAVAQLHDTVDDASGVGGQRGFRCLSGCRSADDRP
jgi:hypothetical protein